MQEREIRGAVREQRHKERTLRKQADASAVTSADDSKISATRRSTRGGKKAAKKVQEEEKEWVFDCICGDNGINYVQTLPRGLGLF